MPIFEGNLKVYIGGRAIAVKLVIISFLQCPFPEKNLTIRGIVQGQ
nr:MAG TPA_asm: hypothetical protein [Bacteriophage sp.]